MVTVNSRDKLVDLDKDHDDSVTSQQENGVENHKDWERSFKKCFHLKSVKIGHKSLFAISKKKSWTCFILQKKTNPKTFLIDINDTF